MRQKSISRAIPAQAGKLGNSLGLPVEVTLDGQALSQEVGELTGKECLAFGSKKKKFDLAAWTRLECQETLVASSQPWSVEEISSWIPYNETPLPWN